MNADAAADPLESAYRQMLAETMRPCPELPIGERLAKRESDAARQTLMHSQAGETVPGIVDRGAA